MNWIVFGLWACVALCLAVVVVGIIIGFRRRKNVETLLHESNYMQTLALEAANAGTFDVLFDSMRCCFDNKSLDIFGLSEEHRCIDANMFYDFVHPDDIAMLEEVHADVVANLDTYEVRYRIIRRDGEVRTVEARGLVIRNEDGRATRVVGVNYDVTEKQEIEGSLRKAKEKAEAADKAKSEFLATMSHEIRTPLNGVIGMASLLNHTNLDEEQRDCVDTINTSAESLLTIINDILDFSKIEARKITLASKPFNVLVCVEDTIDLYAVQAANKKVELVSWVKPSVSHTVLGDDIRLRQVLGNLISNAIKFTPEGGRIKAIVDEVELPAENNTTKTSLHFTINDTGIGIEKGQQETIFDPFTQADASDSRRYKGTGLGLAICRRLVELMAGKIWVESTPGQGAMFHFIIPAQPVSPEKVSLVPVTSRLTGKKALVISTREDCGACLFQQLSAWRMNVNVQMYGNECVTDVDRFDICIIDSLQFAEEEVLWGKIVATMQEAAIPVIALTPLYNRNRFSDLEGVMNMPKPIKQTRLLQALLGLIQARDVENYGRVVK